MYRIIFELGTFKDSRDREWLTPLLVPLVESLAGVNVAYLSRNPRTPSLYQSGVVYSDDQETCDSCEDLWWDIPVVLSHGFGDCEDLAAWRIAELWMQGIAARPHVTSGMNGRDKVLYHIQVMYPDGQIEDPSRILGMGQDQVQPQGYGQQIQQMQTPMMAAGYYRQLRGSPSRYY